MGTIHKIDLGDETPKSESFILTQFDVKKVKVPGARAHAIVRQMRKRTRAEFEGNGLPKGNYRLAYATSCPSGNSLTAAQYKNWRELLEVKIVSPHVSVEKSHPDIDLRPGGSAGNFLEEKSLALFQRQKNGKFLKLDCQVLK